MGRCPQGGLAPFSSSGASTAARRTAALVAGSRASAPSRADLVRIGQDRSGSFGIDRDRSWSVRVWTGCGQGMGMVWTGYEQVPGGATREDRPLRAGWEWLAVAPHEATGMQGASW